MAITITLPRSLKDWMGGNDQASCHGQTIGECVDDLDRNFSGFKKRILDENGEIKESIMIFINGENIRNLGNGLATPVKENEEISIIPFMAGG